MELDALVRFALKPSRLHPDRPLDWREGYITAIGKQYLWIDSQPGRHTGQMYHRDWYIFEVV